MEKRFLPRSAALLLVMPLMLGLSACSSLGLVKKTDDQGLTTAAAAARPYQDNIVIEGRMSLRYQQNYTENAVYGSFVWVQTPAHTLVTLRSPLGQTVATIALTPTQATLRQSGQPPQSATDVDSLAANALGWPLPISGLRHWLQGYTLEQDRRIAADPASEQALTTADGWSLTYADWQAGPEPARPRRIDLLRHTAQAGDISLRLVIDEWLPGEASSTPAVTADSGQPAP